MASRDHRQDVSNAFGKVEVPLETTPEELVSLIMPTKSKKLEITLIDEDLAPEGPCHNTPLHVSVKFLGKQIPMVLVDNGSTLNVFLLKTTYALSLGPQSIR